MSSGLAEIGTKRRQFDQMLLFLEKSLKVARVVNLKLVFTDSFLYNLAILIKLCKI